MYGNGVRTYGVEEVPIAATAVEDMISHNTSAIFLWTPQLVIIFLIQTTKTVAFVSFVVQIIKRIS